MVTVLHLFGVVPSRIKMSPLFGILFLIIFAVGFDEVKTNDSDSLPGISTEEIPRCFSLDEFNFKGCVTPENICPNVNVTFWYYNRTNPEQPIKLSVSDPESFNRLEKNNDPWKILIHGYTKSKDEIPNPHLRSEYFKKDDYNIISVDYNPLARDKCYIFAVKNVPLIANCTAQMIDTLVQKGFFRPEHLHVIGFSLGAQIAGNLQYFIKRKPGRVTGLDPAGPLFDGIINKRINKNSGDFVDVIHTNANFKGMLSPGGHADFYLNGGTIQPGCPIFHFSSCSHDRSVLYYAESIHSEVGFWGIPCGSIIDYYNGKCNGNTPWLMGEHIDHKASGSFYLETFSEPPFAKGKPSFGRCEFSR